MCACVWMRRASRTAASAGVIVFFPPALVTVNMNTVDEPWRATRTDHARKTSQRRYAAAPASSIVFSFAARQLSSH